MSPPYPPRVASLGGHPSVIPDIPVCAVFLVLFLIGAVSHMTILQVNLRRGHKFIMSGMIFGFCMARITATILRMAWATHQSNIRLAIAAQIFVAAGVVLLFIVNLLFAQRIIRAQHPNSGWHPVFHYLFLAIYSLIIVSLIMIITSTVQSFYTLNANTHRIDRDIQLYGQTYFTVVGFLPIPIVLLGLVIPRRQHTEKFGSGRFRNKIYILLTASTLLALGAAFRVGTNYKTPRPINDPPGYMSKACFYIFNFTIEILVVYLYIFVRIDQRFWVPNGSHGPGDYSRHLPGEPDPRELEKRSEEEEDSVKRGHKAESFVDRHINSEEEVFDDRSPEDMTKKQRSADEEKAIELRATGPSS